MSQSSNAAPRISRAIMPPYRLSADLPRATFETPPRPSPGASWRRDRIRRLIQGIVACRPTDAVQARLVAQVLNTLALADTILTRAQAPDFKAERSCRLARTAAEPMRAAMSAERSLARRREPALPPDEIPADENIASYASLLACRTAQGGQ